MLRDLPREERLLLLRFVCAFAWSDLEVQEQERRFVSRLTARLALDAEERAQVEEWLELGVAPEEVDPNRVPQQHRELFLRVVGDLIRADGVIDPNEAEDYALLKKLLG